MLAESNLLLVEDNPDEEALMLHALQQYGLGHRAIVARDGVEALHRLCPENDLRPSPAPPAALVTDLKLPRLDGFELLRRVRADERTCLTPVIILTGSASPEDIREAYRLGANSFIVKPAGLDRYVDTLGLLARYWLKVNLAARNPGPY